MVQTRLNIILLIAVMLLSQGAVHAQAQNLAPSPSPSPTASPKIVHFNDDFCGLIAGAVYCWGPRLGRKTASISPTRLVGSPRLYAPFSSGVTDIAMPGIAFGFCAIQNGVVRCLGQDNNSFPIVIRDQTGALVPFTGASKVYEGCAIKNRALYCWGQDTEARLISTPGPISAFGAIYDDVIRPSESCIISNGVVWCSELEPREFPIVTNPQWYKILGISGPASRLTTDIGIACIYDGGPKRFKCWGRVAYNSYPLPTDYFECLSWFGWMCTSARYIDPISGELVSGDILTGNGYFPLSTRYAVDLVVSNSNDVRDPVTKATYLIARPASELSNSGAVCILDSTLLTCSGMNFYIINENVPNTFPEIQYLDRILGGEIINLGKTSNILAVDSNVAHQCLFDGTKLKCRGPLLQRYGSSTYSSTSFIELPL